MPRQSRTSRAAWGAACLLLLGCSPAKFIPIPGLAPASAEDFARKARTLETRQDFAGAAEAYRQAIARKPKEGNFHFHLGRMLARTGDTDGAIGSYREAVRLDPEHFEAHNAMGLLLERRGDLDGAIAAYREAVRLNPDYTGARDNQMRAEGHKQAPPGEP